MEDLGMQEEANKIEVEIWWEERDGHESVETLRFTGVEVDSYDTGTRGPTVTLYQDPDGGYLVHEVDEWHGRADLFPEGDVDLETGEHRYNKRFTAQEIARKWPRFSDAVNIRRVRDIDIR